MKADGSKAKSEWIFDTSYNSWFYIKADGRYARQRMAGNYYLKAGGYMAKSEWVYDSNYKSWFYLKADGSYANQEWYGKYYFKSDGYMAKSEWVYDSNYKSWFYLPKRTVLIKPRMVWKYYLKSGGYIAKVNGFMIVIIRAGSTSKRTVLMPDKNGKKLLPQKQVATLAKSEWVYDSNYKSWSTQKVLSKPRMVWEILPQIGWLHGQSEWVYDPAYSSYYYLKSDGSYANQCGKR